MRTDNVVEFRPRSQRLQGGVSYAQAMELFERYFRHERPQAMPSIAADLGLTHEVCAEVFYGRAWPGARRFWLDRVLP